MKKYQDIVKALELASRGYSQREIAIELGVSLSTIKRELKKHPPRPLEIPANLLRSPAKFKPETDYESFEGQYIPRENLFGSQNSQKQVASMSETDQLGFNNGSKPVQSGVKTGEKPILIEEILQKPLERIDQKMKKAEIDLQKSLKELDERFKQQDIQFEKERVERQAKYLTDQFHALVGQVLGREEKRINDRNTLRLLKDLEKLHSRLETEIPLFNNSEQNNRVMEALLEMEDWCDSYLEEPDETVESSRIKDAPQEPDTYSFTRKELHQFKAYLNLKLE